MKLTPKEQSSSREISIGVLLQNESRGYPQNFSVRCIGVFGDNGWLYLPKDVLVSSFDLSGSKLIIEVGPGATEEKEITCRIGEKVKKAKVWININGTDEIFNLDLEKI